MGGTPFPGPGGYPLPRSRWGVPHPADGGTPFPGLGGYPHLDLGRGYPHLGKGYPPSRPDPRTGGYPLLVQHSMYLLRGGRCASCVHAGGLSCLKHFIVGLRWFSHDKIMKLRFTVTFLFHCIKDLQFQFISKNKDCLPALCRAAGVGGFLESLQTHTHTPQWADKSLRSLRRRD